MRAACRQHGAVGFEMPVPHYNDTVTELAVKSLVVQLLEDLLKMTRKIHCPRENTEEKRVKTQQSSTQSQSIERSKRGVGLARWLSQLMFLLTN